VSNHTIKARFPLAELTGRQHGPSTRQWKPGLRASVPIVTLPDKQQIRYLFGQLLCNDECCNRFQVTKTQNIDLDRASAIEDLLSETKRKQFRRSLFFEKKSDFSKLRAALSASSVYVNHVRERNIRLLRRQTILLMPGSVATHAGREQLTVAVDAAGCV